MAGIFLFYEYLNYIYSLLTNSINLYHEKSPHPLRAAICSIELLILLIQSRHPGNKTRRHIKE